MLNEIARLKRKIKVLEEEKEDIDRRRRIAWRRYFIVKKTSLPKTCPKCDSGLLIERVNSNNGGIYAACSNYPLMCKYYVKEKKKEFNAYKLKYNRG